MFLRNIGYMATRLNSDLFYKAVQFVSVIYVTKNTCCYIFTFGVDLLQVAFENSVLRYQDVNSEASKFDASATGNVLPVKHDRLSFYYSLHLDETNAGFNYRDGTLQTVKYAPSYWLTWQQEKIMQRFTLSVCFNFRISLVKCIALEKIILFDI